MDYFFYLFVILGFFAVFGLIEGLYLAWNAYKGPEAKRIERRLLAMSAGQRSVETPLLKKRLLSDVPALEKLMLRLPRIHHLDRLLQQSGTSMNVASFIAISLLLALAPATAAVSFALPLPAMAVGIVGLLLPSAYVLRLRSRRLRSIEEQLPDALDLMARALQAGHAFSSALNMVATEGPEPIAQEFRITFDEINFGVSLQDALMNLSARVASTDLRYFVIAVLIQRETGGNLAELLTSIATMIRERLRLAGTVRVLSAEGRMSAWILGVLPFLVAGGIELINPDFMQLLWKDPAGVKMVSGALVLMLAGIVWMWRIIAIRV